MSKPTKQRHFSGANRRTVTCSFCGQEHRRNSKELDDCRRLHRGKAATTAAKPKATGKPRAGSEITRYGTDPLKGDKRGHAILRMHRGGWPDRKIAKTIGVSVDVVRETLRKATTGL